MIPLLFLPSRSQNTLSQAQNAHIMDYGLLGMNWEMEADEEKCLEKLMMFK